MIETTRGTLRIAEFVVKGSPPPQATTIAMRSFIDTIGVIVAGSVEPSARLVQELVAADGGDSCRILGTGQRASAAGAALANGTAGHALDFDDSCTLLSGHPSAPLVAALLSAGELAAASGRQLLDAYVIGFEIECRLGLVMNPRHYRSGWHCTSTIGTIGTAAACARILGLDPAKTANALAIAASEASGLKQNFGTMVKPLHVGLAARNGILAALLARQGMTGSGQALVGPQGFQVSMCGERASLDESVEDLDVRWHLVETGIKVKLYPSCAGTHPFLDALLELQRLEHMTPDDIEGIDIDVDTLTPTILLYERPATGLEAKFSLPFCAAAAIVDGQVGIDTFRADRVEDPVITTLLPRIRMRVDPALDAIGQPLSQARIEVRTRSGRVFSLVADGARGYPSRPVSDVDLAAKFTTCAARTVSASAAARALAALRRLDTVADIRRLTDLVDR
jgi:2-methylcitrate dehydratase PrpD